LKLLKNERRKLGVVGSIWFRVMNYDCRQTIHVHPCGSGWRRCSSVVCL